MAKEKKAKKNVSLLGYDPVETPEEIIDADKNDERREAFKEAYKVVMKIIPNYFMNQKKRKNTSGSTGGTAFSQNIIVTPENVKVETKEMSANEEVEQDRERD